MASFILPWKPRLPSAIGSRSLILQRKANTRNTSNSAAGFRPASLVVLHRSLVPAFKRFCQANSGPLPLLGQSEPEYWMWPTLGAVPGIRTVRPQFQKYEFGDCTGSLVSLGGHSEQLKDMVISVLDCSFTLERALEKVGFPKRDPKGLSHAGACKTTVPGAPVAGFCCPLVATMRPVPKDKLERLLQATCSMGGDQGQPFHIRDPERTIRYSMWRVPARGVMIFLLSPPAKLLGIKALSRPDYGGPVEWWPGDIPLFWPSPLTSLEAVSSCKALLAFTSTPGRPVMTDLKDTKTRTSCLSPEATPEVRHVSQDPLHCSSASASAVQIRVEATISKDPGDVASFACNTCKFSPPQADPGPSHAAGPLQGTQAQGCALDTGSSPLSSEELFAICSTIPIVERKRLRLQEGQGLTQAGTVPCKTSNNPALMEPVFYWSLTNHIREKDAVLEGDNYMEKERQTGAGVGASSAAASDRSRDGGEQLGMGRVKEAGKRHVLRGDVTACDVGADFAVTAVWVCSSPRLCLQLPTTMPPPGLLEDGVGALWLSEAEHQLVPNLLADHTHPEDPKALPGSQREEKMLDILVQHRVSGGSGVLGMEVDRLPFHSVHTENQKLVDTTKAHV
ncbi:LOW QUALITY PROTEIN: D-glutamate cyclase, mitochondrial [Callospermophilus lateralis]